MKDVIGRILASCAHAGGRPHEEEVRASLAELLGRIAEDLAEGRRAGADPHWFFSLESELFALADELGHECH